ncbi:hypothetical protein [Legionella clemsonensis]|uniref:Uncharacterized protein n=1 Tax=Legionella clemsonensis TaxID=1867846 RepID=A0A222P3Y3_9GAMM|nr:hypothetical protein [Legionella clemsonensis]ASQ46543.1 hypothetical protein clem_09970 [Legionella clemsonensis]
MRFFKVSKKTVQKTTAYIRYSDAPEGNTVVCIAIKENGEKKVLLKTGDIEGNETLFSNTANTLYSGASAMEIYNAKDEEGFEDEIEREEEKFAISREIFCAELVRDVDPNCAPNYNRYYEADTQKPLIGPDFITNFQSWKSSYHYENQTILGFAINTAGFIDFPSHAGFPAQRKRIRGLGVCAVLLAILGKDDRGGENWGLVEKYNHLQVVLIDFGRCLCRIMFADEEKNQSENSYKDPFDIVKTVFQQYDTSDEPPLPESFFKSTHIKYEIFETIEKLYGMSATLEKRADDNFKEFPRFKTAILHDKRRGIEHLYHQFKNNKEYIATQYINKIIEKAGISIKLSDLDSETATYLQSLYTYLKPFETSIKHDLFFKHIMKIFNPESPNETLHTTPQSM